MRSFLILLATLIISLPAAATKKFGVGVLLGDPTALSAKYFLDNRTAIDAGLSFGGHYFMLFGDYLKHFPGSIKANNAFISSLNPYVGIGPLIAVDTEDDPHDHHHHIFEDDDDDFALGARIPLGIEWSAREIPLGVSLELVPGILIVPATEAFFQGGLAVRYYF